MSWVAVFDIVLIYIVAPIALMLMRDYRNGMPFRLDVWLNRWTGLDALPQ